MANILQSDAWFQPMLKRLEPGKQVVIVCALPLYHIFALTACMLGTRLGFLNILIPNPRDLGSVVEALRAPHQRLPGRLFNALANDASVQEIDFSELVISNGGGMVAVQQATAERWLQVTGCPVVEGCGLSETSPVATINPLDLREFTGSIGACPAPKSPSGDDAGRPVPTGERGARSASRPQVMAGYWQRPDETAW